jgi:eukaryotic-like serine/threonine-protein kinase
VFGETRPDGSSSLLVRRLDSIDSTPVAGSETAILPFWSPDSRQVAFFADSPKDPALTELRITDLQGGGPRTIVSLPPSDAAGSWNADGLVLVASRGTKGIQRISVNGGQLTPVTTLDPSGGEIAHLYPQFLPDGRHFIYQAATSARENWAIFIGSIDSPVRRKLVQSDYAQFAAPNLLVYTQRENLVAQTMDLSTLALTGQPAVIATGIASLPVNGRAAFSVSDTGVLVYKSSPEPQAPIERHLTWLDRSGKVLNVVGPPVTSSVVRLSPDGTRVALLEVPTSLWVADLARDVKAPVLRTQASSPTWSADGTRLLFGVTTLTFNNQSALFERDAGGATPMKTLPAGKGFPRLLPFDETSDGTLVLFGRAGGNGHRGIGMLSTADGKVTTYLDNNFTGSQAALSPDRRFLAYTSTETNPSQVIVQTFPDPSGGKWVISTHGGSAPRWRRDGRELFYVDAEQRLVSVPVTAGSSFVPGRATPLFSLPVSIQTNSSGAYGYDAAADGQRFLVSFPPDSASAKAPAIPLTVITNWTMLLKKGAR